MLPKIQHDFAKKYEIQDIDQFRTELGDLLGCPIEFKISEMPIFVSKQFKKTLEDCSVELLLQCTTDEYINKTQFLLEEQYTVPNQSKKPLFAVVDFAVTKNSLTGEFEPKLVELQGFPSLYGYQYFYAEFARKKYDIPQNFDSFFSSLTYEKFYSILNEAICGNVPSENVILLELRPEEQKTKPDFYAIKKLLGVESVNIEDVIVKGSQLYYIRDGKEIHIKRIFNRTIIDELQQEQASIPIAWNKDYDVEWAGHPNWYFLISKYTLPFFNHYCVPKTYFLDNVKLEEIDLTFFVLKPLFSFAGKGVIINPTLNDISIIPHNERKNYILQEKIEYDPCIYTPYGMNKVEIRVMMVWLPEWEKPLPVSSLTRSGRGEMMGVRYNTIPWTGSAGCFFEA